MWRLNQHEPLKAEILSSYARLLKTSAATGSARKKHELVKSIVDKLLFEWNQVNEVCVAKIKRLEMFKSRLNSLDLRLNKIREHVQKIEAYLSSAVSLDWTISDYRGLVERKAKLESLLECIQAMNPDAETLFAASLKANKTYLGILL